MKAIKSRFLFLMLAVMLCVTAFAVPAFAYEPASDDMEATGQAVVILYPEEPTETETPAPVNTANILSALTPDGNLSLIDDFLYSTINADGEKEEKQFITVRSKSGAYYFIVIDRAGDRENVYFLNMVDDADLFALMDEEQTEEQPPVCICDDKCYAGHVDTTCAVCAVNMAACAGIEPEPEPSPEATESDEPDEPIKGSAGATVLVVLLILAVAVGAAWYVMRVRGKAKPKTKGAANLDDYDYGADGEEPEEEEYAVFEQADEDDPENGGYWPDSGGYGPDSEGDAPGT